MKKRNITAILAFGAVAGLTLAGCSSNTDDSNTGDDGNDPVAACGTVDLGFIPSWTDGLSTAYLLENQLGALGYEVEMTEIPDAAPLYTGLANGDVDIYPSAWPEVTHAAYMEQYGDDIEDLGAYYDNAKLTIAVPSYVDIDSIEDLKGNADRFGGRIVGIEPGAGLTAAATEMLTTYGLNDEYELVTSSTGAMTAELDTATKAEEDIVVTLWRPFWANAPYDMKDLEDPKGAMGDTEALHFLATKGFSDRCPEVADLIAGIQLDDEQYGSLEDMVVNEYGEGKEAEAVAAWVEANPDAFSTEITE